MGIVELQDYIRKELKALGGREAILLAMRAAGMDADTIKMAEYWTNGFCD